MDDDDDDCDGNPAKLDPVDLSLTMSLHHCHMSFVGPLVKRGGWTTILLSLLSLVCVSVTLTHTSFVKCQPPWLPKCFFLGVACHLSITGSCVRGRHTGHTRVN